MPTKLSDHLNISLGLSAPVDSATVVSIIADTDIAMDSGTTGNFIATITGEGGVEVLNSGTNNAAAILKLDSDVAATTDNTLTLTNKTINLSNNTLTGTIGQWNAALSGGNSFATLTGTETLTNKTLTSPTINSIAGVSGSITDISTLSLRDNTATSFELFVEANSSVTQTADRTLTFDVQNADRTLSTAGDLTFAGAFELTGAYATTFNLQGTTALTLPTSGTLLSKDGSNNVSGINNITVTGTVDGRDIAVDGAKLDTIEDSADVTDSTNVGAALTGFSSGADAVATDLIAVYDVSSGAWEKHTIQDAALQGDQGVKGQKGEAGATGSDGLAGDDGAQGQKGQKGEVGVTGSAGSAGVKGQKGQKGEVGSTGADGADGLKGQKGQKGEEGVAGSGASGIKGQKGEVGSTGATGDTGTKGQKGELGGTGNTGSAGTKGQKGETGAAGATGSAGAKGQKGETNASITQTTAPSGAVDGDFWWDDETGSLYIYYNDGSSSQWVQFNNSVVSDGAITTAKLADDAVTRAKLASEVSLIIYNSGGTALKTIYGAGS